jgi:hypothetical protein
MLPLCPFQQSETDCLDGEQPGGGVSDTIDQRTLLSRRSGRPESGAAPSHKPTTNEHDRGRVVARSLVSFRSGSERLTSGSSWLLSRVGESDPRVRGERQSTSDQEPTDVRR